MKIDELVQLAFSIQQHKNNIQYDCIKYNFKVSNSQNKQLQIFFNQNKFQLQPLTKYDLQQAKFRLIISIFINNKQAVDCSDKDYNKLIQQLTEYKNEFIIYIKQIANNINEFNQETLYRAFIKKEIPFYVFYYFIKYIRFDSVGISNELIKRHFLIVHKLMMFFKVFDEEYIKGICETINKHLEMNKI